MRKLVLSVDEEKLTQQCIQQLVKIMPGKEEVDSLMAYRDKVDELADAERFIVIVSPFQNTLDQLQQEAQGY